MLHEHTDLINELKTKNARFASLCQKHKELDVQIDRGSLGAKELEILKKEKLRLKDEIYSEVLKYKNSI
ncbi:DUF465 domain-containing protein [Campylobacter sp. RM13119]|uniref:YdcH family protein n=1 Tax=Campylobacter TaxID=194 RepID=UPI001474A631|nr:MULTISPECIES: DUF465 domain-containing protein [unclassified Campylobacter]MBE3022462.1 DUF465 domain-containing protein [Campylobacter sp. 7477a]MBE3606299.1 DUF465 domain-containing protein [Campylobacter sp. RM13119]MBE3608976.1 DUF465 domain-containing protein [Campylobacter sp. RM12916]